MTPTYVTSWEPQDLPEPVKRESTEPWCDADLTNEDRRMWRS